MFETLRRLLCAVSLNELDFWISPPKVELNLVASVQMKSFVFYVRPTRFVKCSDRQFYEFYSTTESEKIGKYFLHYSQVWSVSRRLEDCDFDFALIRFTSLSRGEHGRVFWWLRS